MRKHMNEVLWNGARMPPHEIVLRTGGWMHEFHKWHKPQTRRTAKEFKKWRKPGVRWIKCNFNGAWSKGSSRGGYGVMLRDHTCVFLGTMAGSIEGYASALYSELIAARHAVRLVKRLYPPDVKVKLEGDSSVVMAAMKGKGDDDSIWGSIINDLRFFLKELPYMECGHVQREGNSIAHRLARMDLSCFQEVVWFEKPPDLIQDLLFEEDM
ncbi:uncharacterized protein LOC103936456 [Pyrus x bretschneideri]|nr:uncharacterized protein LOC103936456 [Pyrus x bretschneideri]